MTSLYEQGTAIRDSFATLEVLLANHADAQQDQSYDRLKTQEERYFVWAVNLGLFDAGHSSLDYRLQDADAARHFVRTLLSQLHAYLQELYSTLLPGYESVGEVVSVSDETLSDRREDRISDCSDRESGSSDETNDFEALSLSKDAEILIRLSAVGDVVDRLIQVASTIRNPTTRSAQGRRDVYGMIDPEFRAIVIPRLIDFESNRVLDLLLQMRRDLTEDPENDTTEIILTDDDKALATRIGTANSRRRQQFMHWQRRQDRSISALATLGEHEPRSTPKPAPHVQPRRVEHVEGTVANKQSIPSSVTKIQPREIDFSDRKSVISNVTRTPSARGPSGEKVAWPLAPSGLPEDSHFTCPYCFTLCPNRYRSQSGWKAHLIRDLKPYCCTYVLCDSGDTLYDSWEEWATHEAMTHNHVWRCLENDLPEFSDKSDYVDHIKKYHRDSSASLLSPQLLSAARGASSTSNRTCPFCLAEDQNSETMRNHVAFHLETSALCALPQSTGLEEGSEQGDLDSNQSKRADQGPQPKDSSWGSLPSATFDVDDTLPVEASKDVVTASALEALPEAGQPIEALEIDPNQARAVLGMTESVNDRASISSAYQTKSSGVTNLESTYGAPSERFMTQRDVENLGVPAENRREEGNEEDAGEGPSEETYQRALVGTEKALGPNHVSTLDIVNNLGLLHKDQGRMAEAEQMYQRALAGYQIALGPYHPSTLSTFNSLGSLYRDQGKIVEAEEMYIRALRGYEKAWGPQHTSTLDTVGNLGNLYADQGKMAEAETMYVRALRGYEKALGPQHTSTLDTVSNLGNLYADQGKRAEAEAMYVRALRGYEKAWGVEHTSTLNTVNNLGNLYADQGKMAEAETMYVRALRGREKALGVEHTSTLNTVNNLGLLYADQGKMAEAETMYVRALRGREKVLGVEHTSTLRTVNNLGLLYADQGKMAEAEEMYVRALRGREKAWGVEHMSTLRTVNNLGNLYADQGKLAEAEAMYMRALRGFEKAWGVEHTSTLRSVNNLGLLYADQGKMAEAEAMYMRALRGYEKARGAEHTLMLDTVNNLGLLYADQGKMMEAEEMYVRALRGYEKAVGKDHPRTQKIARNLQGLHARK